MRCKACNCITNTTATQEVIVDNRVLTVEEVLCQGCRRESEIEITAADIFGYNDELQVSLGNGNYYTDRAPNPDDL